MQYYTVIAQSGQSLVDIILQEYGTADIAVLNMLVIDNANVLSSITTVPAVGLSLNIRSNSSLRNSNIANVIGNVNQQSDAESNSSLPIETDGEGEITGNNEIEFSVGQFPKTRAVFLNVWWQEKGYWFIGTIRIIHNNQEPKLAHEYSSWESQKLSKLIFTTYFDADNIILQITNNESDTVYFFYNVVTPH